MEEPLSRLFVRSVPNWLDPVSRKGDYNLLDTTRINPIKCALITERGEIWKIREAAGVQIGSSRTVK